jgi:hypothetical protein
MAGLQSLLDSHVDNGSVPGAVGLAARGDRTEVAVAGSVAIGGDAMARNSIRGTCRDATAGSAGPGPRRTSPPTATVAIMLTQVATDGPVSLQWMRDFWRYAVG